MMSKGSKLSVALDWGSTSARAENLSRCLDQMATTLNNLISVCQAYHEMQCHLEALRDVLLDLQLKPNKKLRRAARALTSTRRKA